MTDGLSSGMTATVSVPAPLAPTAVPASAPHSRGVRVISSGAEAISAAQEYAQSIAAGVIDRDRAGKVPRPELAAFDASGLLGITVPREYGGAQLSPIVLAEVIRTIAAVDPAIAQVPQSHFLFTDVLAVWGSADQQRRIFADVLSGGRLGNGLSERGGQHAQDLRTRLRATGYTAPVITLENAVSDYVRNYLVPDKRLDPGVA